MIQLTVVVQEVAFNTIDKGEARIGVDGGGADIVLRGLTLDQVRELGRHLFGEVVLTVSIKETAAR